MKLRHWATPLCLLGACLPSFALEGVYAGPQCGTMKFDFRPDGQAVVTETAGREGPRHYKVDGDKIAVDAAGDAPGFVLALRDDAVLMQVPATAGRVGHTLVCRRPFEQDGPTTSDPRLVGCWKAVTFRAFKDEGSPAKDLTPSCVIAYSKTQYTSVCKPEGKPVATTEAKYAVRRIGVLSAEVVKADAAPRLVGSRHDSQYTISGDTLDIQTFPRADAPDNPNVLWKFESVSRRVAASECK